MSKRVSRILIFFDLLVYIATVITFFMIFVDAINVYVPMILLGISVTLFVIIILIDERRSMKEDESSHSQ